MWKGLKMAYLKETEKQITEDFKSLLDKDANFARPLSEFWKGCNRDECYLVGHYGVWFSGEGGSMIDRDYAAYYYFPTLYEGSPKIKDFLNKWNLRVFWYDCGTCMLISKNDVI